MGPALRSGCSHWYLDLSSPSDALAAWSAALVRALMRRISETGVHPVVHRDFKNALASDFEAPTKVSVTKIGICGFGFPSTSGFAFLQSSRPNIALRRQLTVVAEALYRLKHPGGMSSCGKHSGFLRGGEL